MARASPKQIESVSRLQANAAVDGDLRAVDIACGVRDEKRHDFRHFPGFRHAADRDRAGEAGVGLD